MSKKPTNESAVALMVVMWVVLVLSLLVSGFAFTMHVETRVASFSQKQLKAEMLARSGMELARRELMLKTTSATEAGFDALNQNWRTNTTLFVQHPLGDGAINVAITDEDSKIPINRAGPDTLHRLLDLLAVDPGDADVIVDSIQDWIDENDAHLLNGAESDYYESLTPPYQAKNAPLDRVEELLMVRGVTPELFYGTPATADTEAIPGFDELFTATSTGRVNVNTASSLVLQAVLGLDDQQVSVILSRRDGPDGVPGTDDDQPFVNLGEFTTLLGQLSDETQRRLGQLISVQASFFTVKSTGEVGGARHTIIAILRRHDGKVLPVSWREIRGDPR